jgi:EAL domain-containing protein (putative c-di-GMP-specific phosphodiesterase class I)
LYRQLLLIRRILEELRDGRDAEGVEGEATLDLLNEFGVDLAQGFYLGKPGPLA